jgi:ABC-type multidrug transport system fused ATPase/permease subunit
LKLKELRANVSMVMQEPLILPATVAENIAYGKPGASRSEIEAAARAANAESFIAKLPQSYDAQIGEGGARLSAGERQRINLARAFLKDAPILLLDEPTSALDAESESLISESIEALVRGRTTLIVAHRPGTIARVHRVMVLEAGRLTGVGTPDELRAQGGYYARVMQA